MAYANTNIAPILEEGSNITLTESEGVITIASSGGGGGTPGGSTTQVQFNDAGAFGGDADWTYDKTTNVQTIKGGVIVSDETASRIAHFDGSKQIKALDTAIYPSLTELSYLKGAYEDMNDFIELTYLRSLYNLVYR